MADQDQRPRPKHLGSAFQPTSVLSSKHDNEVGFTGFRIISTSFAKP